MIELANVSKNFKVYQRPRHYIFERISLKKLHREVLALDNVSLAVKPGECLGVIGTNGAGKSTLLSIMAGISRPSSGTVKVEGRTTAILEANRPTTLR